MQLSLRLDVMIQTNNPQDFYATDSTFKERMANIENISNIKLLTTSPIVQFVFFIKQNKETIYTVILVSCMDHAPFLVSIYFTKKLRAVFGFNQNNLIISAYICTRIS